MPDNVFKAIFELDTKGQGTIKDMSGAVKGLEKDVNTLGKNAIDASKDIDKLENAEESLTKTFKTNEVALKGANNMLAEARQKMKEGTNEVSAFEDAIKGLTYIVKDNEKSLKEMAAAGKTNSEAYKQLKAETEALKKEREAYLKQGQELKAMENSIGGSLDGVSGKFDSLSATLGQAGTTLAALGGNIGSVAGGLTGMGSLLSSIPGQMKSINDAGGSMSDKLMAGATSIGAAVMMGVQMFDSWVQGQDAIVKAAGEAGEELLDLADAFDASGKGLEDRIALTNGLGEANDKMKTSLLAVITDEKAFGEQLAIAKEEARQAKIAAQELNEGGLNPMIRFLTDLDPAMKAHRMRLAEQTVATEEAIAAQVAMAQALNSVQNELKATLSQGAEKTKAINLSLVETFGTQAEIDKARVQAILDEAQAKMKELAPLVQKAQSDSTELQKDLELAKKRRDEFITTLKFIDQDTRKSLAGGQVWTEIGKQIEQAFSAFGKNIKAGKQEIEAFISEWVKDGQTVGSAMAKIVGVTEQEMWKSSFNYDFLNKLWAQSKAELAGLAKNFTEVTAETDALNKATGKGGIIDTYNELKGLTKAQAEALYEQEKAAQKLIETYKTSKGALESLLDKLESQNKAFNDKSIELRIRELEKLGKIEEAEALKKDQRKKSVLEALEADKAAAKQAQAEIKILEAKKTLTDNEKKTLETLRAQVKAYNDLEATTIKQTEDLYKREQELNKALEKTVDATAQLQASFTSVIDAASDTAKTLGNVLPQVEHIAQKIEEGYINMGRSQKEAKDKAKEWADEMARAIASGNITAVTKAVNQLADVTTELHYVISETEDGWDSMFVKLLNGLKLSAERMVAFKASWERATKAIDEAKIKLAAIDAAEQSALDHVQKKLAWLDTYWRSLNPEAAKGFDAVKKLMTDLAQFPELAKEIWDVMGRSSKAYYEAVQKQAKEAHDKQIQLLKDQFAKTKQEYDSVYAQIQGIIGQLKSEREKLTGEQGSIWEEVLGIVDPQGQAMEKALQKFNADVQRFLSIRTDENAAKIDQAINARRLQIRAELQKTFEGMGLTTETTRLLSEFDKQTANVDRTIAAKQTESDRAKVVREALSLLKSGITDFGQLWEGLNKKIPNLAKIFFANPDLRDFIKSAFSDPAKGVAMLSGELDKIGSLSDKIERIDEALASIAKQGIQIPVEQSVFQKLDELLAKLPALSSAMASLKKQYESPFTGSTLEDQRTSDLAAGLVVALNKIKDGAKSIDDVMAGIPESISPTIRRVLEDTAAGGMSLQESASVLESILLNLKGDEFTQGIVQFYKVTKQSSNEIKNLKIAFQSLRVSAVDELTKILKSEDAQNPGLLELLSSNGELMKSILAAARMAGEQGGTQYSAGWNSKIDLKTTPSQGAGTNSIPSLLASGLDDGMQVWESAIDRMAQMLPDYFSVHSPAKLGPLSKEDPKNWTVRLMRLMSEGLISVTDLLSGNVEKVAGLLSSIGQKGLGWLFDTAHFEGTSAKPSKFYGLFEDGLLTPLSEIEKQLQEASQGYSNEQAYERFVTLAQKMADKGQKSMTTTELNELTSSKFFEAFIPKMTFEDLTKNYTIGQWNPYLGWLKGGAIGDERLLPIEELVAKKRAEGKVFEDELAKVQGELGLGFDYNLQTLTNLFKSGAEGRLDIFDPGRGSSTKRSAKDIIYALWNSNIVKSQTGLSSATATGWGIKDWFNGIREAFGFEKASNLSMGISGLENGDWEALVMEQIQKIKDLGFEKAAVYFKNAATKLREAELSTGNGGKGSPFAKLLDEAWIAQNPVEAENLLAAYLKGMAGGGVGDINKREFDYLQSILNRTATQSSGQDFWSGLFAGQKNSWENAQGGLEVQGLPPIGAPAYGGASIGGIRIEQEFNLVLEGDGSNIMEIIKKIATETAIAVQTALLQGVGFRP